MEHTLVVITYGAGQDQHRHARLILCVAQKKVAKHLLCDVDCIDRQQLHTLWKDSSWLTITGYDVRG